MTPQTTEIATVEAEYEPPRLAEAREMAASRLIPKDFQGKTGDVLIAREMGIHLNVPTVFVLQNLTLIGGQPCWKAQFAVALANRARVFRGPIRYRETGAGPDLSVTAYAVSSLDGEPVEATVTMAMARAEGWTRNSKYASIPGQMLRWRAATWLIRATAPEVLLGLYTQDEMEDVGAARGRQGSPPAALPANPSPPSLPAPGGVASAASGGDQPASGGSDRPALLSQIRELVGRLPQRVRTALRVAAGVPPGSLSGASDAQLRDLVERARVEAARRDMLPPRVVELQDRAADLLTELEADSALRLLDEVAVETVDGEHEIVKLERLVEALDRAIEEASAAALDDGEDLPAAGAGA